MPSSSLVGRGRRSSYTSRCSVADGTLMSQEARVATEAREPTVAAAAKAAWGDSAEIANRVRMAARAATAATAGTVGTAEHPAICWSTLSPTKVVGKMSGSRREAQAARAGRLVSGGSKEIKAITEGTATIVMPPQALAVHQRLGHLVSRAKLVSLGRAHRLSRAFSSKFRRYSALCG
jgi:hypothetical protein